VYVQHVAIEGLAMDSGIQGNVADAAVTILKGLGIELTVKLVDYFIFFKTPFSPSSLSCNHSYKFKLQDFLNVTAPLGINWHPIAHKVHVFKTCFSYVGFKWDLSLHSVSLSSEKCLHLLSKISAILSNPTMCLNKKTVMSIHGSLQHVTLVYHHGQHYLPALSIFLSKFPNDFIIHYIHSLVSIS